MIYKILLLGKGTKVNKIVNTAYRIYNLITKKIIPFLTNEFFDNLIKQILRNKYENIKKRTKQKFADEKTYVRQIRGEPEKAFVGTLVHPTNPFSQKIF